jgi:MFS family permease
MVWSGWGLLAVLPGVLMALCGEAASFLAGGNADSTDMMAVGIGAAIGAIIGGALLRPFARRLEEREPWREDTLGGVPLIVWPYVYWVGAPISLVAGCIAAAQV